MKQIFIQLTQEFYQFGLIDSKVKLMLHNNYIDIEDLTTLNISYSFILYKKIFRQIVQYPLNKEFFKVKRILFSKNQSIKFLKNNRQKNRIFYHLTYD